MSRGRKKLLDQKLANEFAEFRALKNKIEKWLKVCSADFIAKLKAGYVCPTEGPYLLELGGQDRKAIDWESAFFKRLTGDFEASGNKTDIAEQMAAEKMTEMERLAGKNHIDQVDVKVNPSYAGKLVRAIVKKLDSSSPRGF